MISIVIKRDGSKVPFDAQKIHDAITKAYKEVNGNELEVDHIVNDILDGLNAYNDEMPVESIQDIVEYNMMNYDKAAAKAYILYRHCQATKREGDLRKLFLSIMNTERNDVTRDNANMNADTPAGMMMKFASETTKPFVDKYMLSPLTKKYVHDNIIYPHDKDYYLTKSLTCIQHPLDRILKNGFHAGHGSSRPAKRIETASMIACISMETIQNVMHGGQAIPAFDYYLAPYVKATLLEELDKVSEVTGVVFDDVHIDDYIKKECNSTDYLQIAVNRTVDRVHQAMEAFIHNMNTIHSRGGNQVVFSSINYGTDTSPEGRCIIREILRATMEGVGNGETAIFPIGIFKVKAGVNYNPEDPNYDLYVQSWPVAAKRFFPNYLNLDSSFNYDDAWKEDDPKRYEHEVATMGCRTRVYENRFGPKTSIGRGNLSFTTINLPKLAIEAALKVGRLIKTNNGIVVNPDYHESYGKAFNEFKNMVFSAVDATAQQLDERFKFQATALKKQFPLLMDGMWNGSEKLGPEDTVASVINQGTLGIGFIGLAEALVALTGYHHGEDAECQKFGLEIVSTMKNIADKWSETLQHNYSILATPAEGLSGTFIKKDKVEYGIIEGVTDKDYYTNSNHVPVWFQCTPSHKMAIECPYHKWTRGGHIAYIEANADITKNPEVIGTIVDIARKYDGGYISINHHQCKCPQCGYEVDEKVNVCPYDGTTMDILQRITGYLVGTTNRWNSAKLAELKDRIVHQ